MEKKYYQIVTKSPEDWKIVHNLLMKDGSLEDNIPERSVECVNDIKHSKTRSTYLMTDEEAELLRQSDRIYNVSLDVVYHPEAHPRIETNIKRFNRNVKNYRALAGYNVSIDTIQSYPPTTRFNGATSSELNRTGYQILRCTSDDNPFSLNSAEAKFQDIDYTTDGTDVDCIIVDNGVFFGHPEFCSNEFDPPNYIRGNVLSRHGICGVLDLILDAPYYLDPDWFNADPVNRLEKRWDGTTVPKEQVARDWWNDPLERSSSFPNFGFVYIKPEYNRQNHCGKDQKSSPTNSPKGDHGTPCASLMYGKTFGWAFNSNKWSISIAVGGNPEGIDIQSSFDIQKIFHKYKPVNPKFGTRNPSVSSNSYGSTNSLYSYGSSGSYSYRNSPLLSYNRASSVPNFLKTAISPTDPRFCPQQEDFISTVVSGREMVDSGVHFICSAGNDGRYIGSPNDEDYNNYIVPSAYSSSKIYINRPGFPAQIGHTPTSTERYKSFIIGAIDDEYTGRFSSGETNVTFTSEPSGKETLARNGYEGFSFARDYSNKGSGVDFYAPADGTLAAQTLGKGEYPNPYQPFTDITYNDGYFNGTSAACPVSAGVIACFVQRNRDLSSREIKTYLRDNIPSQSSSKFFIGPRPGNLPNDPAWVVPFSVMGRAVKIIREVTNLNRTPNESFTPTYGINNNSGANERFVVNNSSGFFHKIEILGIKNFEKTPASYDLNIKTGYYRVGARSPLSVDRLKSIKLRVDPTNPKNLQLSDSDGVDSWDDMEITALNGEFRTVGTEVYYVFSGGTIPGNSAYSDSQAVAPGYTPPSATGGAITAGGDLIVTGNIVAGGDIIGLVSDERLKENIEIIDNAIEKVEKLNGFTYNFNEIGESLGFDPNKDHSGVSAQEVQNVLPEATAPAPANNDYLTVKYDKIIPLLIESIKDLKKDIDDYKNKEDK